MKKLMIISDLHCGHRVGLTPPAWQYVLDPDEPTRYKWAVYQRECWAAFLEMVERAGPVDVLLCNGDMVDGKGTRSGGTELITGDMSEQAHMAAVCIKQIQAREISMTYGTPYHVGMSEDFEKEVATELGISEPQAQDLFRLEGNLFNAKHFVSSSIIPHGRHTAVSRDKLWGAIWADGYGKEKADVTIRSHVHYAAMNYDTPLGFGIITPSLQGLGSRFGSRICSGWVDFGITVVCCDGKGVVYPAFDTTPINAEKLEPREMGNAA